MDRKRRDFLKGIGAIGAAGLVAGPAHGDSTPPPAAPASDASPATPVEQEPYRFLNAAEATWLEAAVDRMVPADALGPGGVDLGIISFIDSQLVGAFGEGAKTYMQGPWPQGTPAQGWQIPLTPAACYRTAIARIDTYCRGNHGAAFSELAADVQDRVLSSLEAGGIDLVELPGHVFFKLLHQNVMEGLFCDPIYGGNRDKLGWKLVGFPGASGNSTGLKPIEFRDIPQDIPSWGSGWKRWVAKYYNRTLSFGCHGSVMPYRDAYLDLDPTYRDAVGDPLLRLTFDWHYNELALSRHATGIVEKIGAAMRPARMLAGADSSPYSIAPYQSTHCTGGAAMGTDRSTSVVNRYLQSWDVSNLFVIGASAFPQNAAYGPTGTVGALAYWAADAIRNRYLKSPGPLL